MELIMKTKEEAKVLYQVETPQGAELLTIEELKAKYTVTGINRNTKSRIEIQGKPVLQGILGPMYNGVNDKGQLIVRYESQKVYDSYYNN